MATIWKYPLQLVDVQAIQTPRLATLLTVQLQNGVPTLWAMVHEKEIPETRYIAIYGTGTPITRNISSLFTINFLGTVQMDGFVWHFFEAWPS